LIRNELYNTAGTDVVVGGRPGKKSNSGEVLSKDVLAIGVKAVFSRDKMLSKQRKR